MIMHGVDESMKKCDGQFCASVVLYFNLDVEAIVNLFFNSTFGMVEREPSIELTWFQELKY